MNGGWTREEDGRVRQPLIYSGALIEWGKKAGKQVIRSTGLSIEVGVGGTWRECTTPYQYTLRLLSFRPLLSRLCPPVWVLQKNAAAYRVGHCRVATTDAICCCCCCYHHHRDSNSWLASSDIDRYFQFLFTVPSVDSCCALVPVFTRPFVRYLTWFFNLVLYCYLVFLPLCSFLLSMGFISRAREKKTKYSNTQANSYMIQSLSLSLSLWLFSLCTEQNTPFVYLFATFMPLQLVTSR